MAHSINSLGAGKSRKTAKVKYGKPIAVRVEPELEERLDAFVSYELPSGVTLDNRSQVIRFLLRAALDTPAIQSAAKEALFAFEEMRVQFAERMVVVSEQAITEEIRRIFREMRLDGALPEDF